MKSLSKLFESYRTFLKERISEVAYHYTSISKLENILKTDRFMTSVATGTQSDLSINRGKMYFFSVARSKQSSYFSTDYWGTCIVVLDGIKLSSNYKGIPVDYWDQYQKSKGKSEMEDRIVVDKPFIENATKYMVEVYISGIIRDDTESIFSSNFEVIQNIENILKEKNIPMYIFVKKGDMFKGRKDRTLSSTKELIEYAKKRGVSIEDPPISGFSREHYTNKEIKRLESIIKMLNVVENATQYEEIDNGCGGDEYCELFLDYLTSHFRDFAIQMGNVIHNYRSEYMFRKPIGEIISFMQKRKIKSVVELGNYLKKKVDDLYKEYRNRK